MDCFYCGQLSLSRGTVSGIIRTANLFGVGVAEKAACGFFVDALSTAKRTRGRSRPSWTASIASFVSCWLQFSALLGIIPELVT